MSSLTHRRSDFPARRGTRDANPVAKQAGFTIIELAAVVLVMSIVAAVAVPSFYSSLHYHELKSAARRLVLDLEQVRQTARLQSTAWSLTFTNDGRYALYAPVEESGQTKFTSLKSLRTPKQPAHFGSLENLINSGAAYEVDLSGSPFQLDNVILDLENTTLTETGDIAITFDGHGYSATSGTITLVRGNRTWDVVVDGPSGNISKSDGPDEL